MFYYAQGTALAVRSELVEKHNELSKFYADLAKGYKPIDVPFSTGVLTADNALIKCDINAQEWIPFEPIGLGKPLTIDIREVYTGKFRSWLNNKKDMLVTSAIKSGTTFNAQLPAVNFIKSKVSQCNRYEVPDAIEVGTRFIYYSPALTDKDKSLSLNLRIIFDDFPESVFDTLSAAFAAAGEIPIFSPEKRGLLLAASWLTEILGNVGETLFDSTPDFEVSEALNIYVAGTVPLKPGYILLTDGNVDKIDSSFRSNYYVNKYGKVVHDQYGTEYDGDIPYIVISIDGTPNDLLKEFTPTVASAAILSRFLGSQDKQNNSKDLVDALKLYNDFRLRKEFDELTQTLNNISDKYDDQIQEISDESGKEELKKKRDAEVKDLKEKQKALVANILEERLKPKMQNP